MELMVLTSMMCSFFIVMALFYKAGQDEARQTKRLEKISGKHREEADEELSKPLHERFLIPLFYGILKAVSKLFPKSRERDTLGRLQRDLKLAGIAMPPSEFSAVRLMVMLSVIGASLLPMFAAGVSFEVRFLIVTAGILLALLIPRYYLKSRITFRQEKIRRDLPDVLDLLSVSVDAGLGFDSAIFRIASQSDSPVAGEFMTVYREIQMGKTRREALKDLGLRTSVEEMKLLAGSIIQAEQLGISVKNILRTQSSQLRISRKQRAEEKAMKAPVKMMLPLVLFVFPVIFIILLGPSVLEIAGMMKG